MLEKIETNLTETIKLLKATSIKFYDGIIRTEFFLEDPEVNPITAIFKIKSMNPSQKGQLKIGIKTEKFSFENLQEMVKLGGKFTLTKEQEGENKETPSDSREENDLGKIINLIKEGWKGYSLNFDETFFE